MKSVLVIFILLAISCLAAADTGQDPEVGLELEEVPDQVIGLELEEDLPRRFLRRGGRGNKKKGGHGKKNGGHGKKKKGHNKQKNGGHGKKKKVYHKKKKVYHKKKKVYHTKSKGRRRRKRSSSSSSQKNRRRWSRHRWGRPRRYRYDYIHTNSYPRSLLCDEDAPCAEYVKDAIEDEFGADVDIRNCDADEVCLVTDNGSNCDAIAIEALEEFVRICGITK